MGFWLRQIEWCGHICLPLLKKVTYLLTLRSLIEMRVLGLSGSTHFLYHSALAKYQSSNKIKSDKNMTYTNTIIFRHDLDIYIVGYHYTLYSCILS